MLRALTILLIGLLWAGTPVRAEFEKGHDAYQRGDYLTALNEWLDAADAGDLRAHYGIGLLYEQGLAVPITEERALEWYGEAAAQGFVPAQHRLGLLYANGSLALRDFVQAYFWLNLAASDRRYQGRAQALRHRDAVVDSMTSVEFTEAKRISRSKQKRGRAVVGANPARGVENERGGSPSPNRFVTAARIAGVQRELTALGYDPGPTDGVLGPKTRRAISAFQSDHDLPETGEVSDALDAALRIALRIRIAGNRPARRHNNMQRNAMGSGFFVSEQGHILTAHHVIAGCREVRIGRHGRTDHIASDPQNDLALLKIAESPFEAATFREGSGLRHGDDLIVAGFPPKSHVTGSIVVTEGEVSESVAGGGDDRVIWTNVPVMAGNSGGPALDASGNVVGLIFAKLKDPNRDSPFDDLPENISFAINEATVRAFLDAQGVPYDTTPSNATYPIADIVAMAEKFTVPIECWD